MPPAHKVGLSLRRFGVVETRNYMRNSFSQWARRMTGTWTPAFRSLTNCFSNWATPLAPHHIGFTLWWQPSRQQQCWGLQSGGKRKCAEQLSQGSYYTLPPSQLHLSLVATMKIRLYSIDLHRCRSVDWRSGQWQPFFCWVLWYPLNWESRFSWKPHKLLNRNSGCYGTVCALGFAKTDDFKLSHKEVNLMMTH